MQKSVFDVLDLAVEKVLRSITLRDLVIDAEGYKSNNGFMFYI